MATKYVKIVATGPSVKISDGSITAAISNPAVTARTSSPTVNVPDPALDINIAITGLPPDNRPPDEPLFKYVGDNYTIITTFAISLQKYFFDTVTKIDQFTVQNGKGVVELVDPTDDFDGLATAEDDQVASLSKVTIEIVGEVEAISLGMGKPFSDDSFKADSYFFGIGRNIADSMGDTVERLIFDLSRVMSDTPAATEAVSLGPNKALDDMANKADTLVFGLGPGVADTPAMVERVVNDIAPSYVEALSDTEVLSFDFGQVLSELPVDTEQVSIGVGKNPADGVTKSDSGLLLMQGYFSQDYWFDDYNGVKTTF